jgi:alkanesulfonate monooxygenase SsuD/methylene tetrahydromethanopterin reductase-like flavin-dependent oxidoreductase (luciferase family)
MPDEVPMKFYISPAFLETGEIVEIAKAADDLGYDGIGIPDHVVNLDALGHAVPVHKGRTTPLATRSPTGPIPGCWSARSRRQPRACTL